MPKAQPQVSETAHVDANQNNSLIAVQGTLGTADIQGTAPTIPLGANPDTGALYVQDLSGVSGTTNIQGSVIVTSGTVLNTGSNINIVSGTQQTLGTIGTIQGVGTLTNLGSVTNIGSLTNIGTIKEVSNIVGGTLGTILGIGGTVQVAGASAGTDVNIVTGTLHELTLIPKPPSAQISSTTALAALNATLNTTSAYGATHMALDNTIVAITGTWVGTISFLASQNNSTFYNIKAVDIVTGTVGTIATANGVWMINGATWKDMEIKMTDYTSGTANVAFSASPIALSNVALYQPLPSGTNSLGTIGISSLPTLNLTTGTVTSVGTIVGLGTATNVGSLTNIGTLKGVDLVTRIGNIGTIESGTVTTSLALNTGTITTIAAGTQNTLGTVGTVIGIGTLTGVGALPAHAISLGTVLGPNASAGTSTTAPVQIGGTTATGTVYGILTDTAGHLHVDQETGTISVLPQVSVGTIPQVSVGTLPVVSLASSGTLLNLATGTLANSGTTTGVGVVTSVTNIVSGTLLSAGTTTGVGVVTNLTSGSVRMTVGTLTTGSLTTVASILSQSAGTLNTLGTVGVVNNGTISINNKVAGSVILTTQTQGTTGAAVWGTMISPVGAGTYIYLSGLSIVVASGTVDTAITTNIAGSTGAGVIARGNFPAGGGIMRDFTYPIQIGTNGTLAYWLGGAGTVSLTANYWVGP